MIDAFIFVGLPYIALVVCVAGCIWKARQNKFGMSARSSQFLEDGQLLYGSTPWHIGILVVLAGHIIAGVLPRVWSSLASVPAALFIIETIGIGASLLALFGLTLLMARRVRSGKVQAVTTRLDLLVLLLLWCQVLVGLLSAIHLQHGAAWSTGTVVPYFWSLVTLRPDSGLVSDFPMLFKLHLVGAWLLILLVPFTRLMHVLVIPVQYLWRAPQLVVWNTARRGQQVQAIERQWESRREFLKGAAGVAGAGGLMALGVSEKALHYFKGPSSDLEAESALLSKKLQRLQQTADERALELERQRNDMIVVVRYTELSENKGKYFIDYQMAPGLAFKGKDGVPLLISAKCTHLGCTVGSDLDAQGRILCPCHVSYFDIRTGMPNEGAPAKAPLPHLSWALVDAAGKVVASRRAGGPLEGATDPAQYQQCSLYIVKSKQGLV